MFWIALEPSSSKTVITSLPVQNSTFRNDLVARYDNTRSGKRDRDRLFKVYPELNTDAEISPKNIFKTNNIPKFFIAVNPKLTFF